MFKMLGWAVGGVYVLEILKKADFCPFWVGFAQATHSRSRFWYDTPTFFERWHVKQLQAPIWVPNNQGQKSIGGSGDPIYWILGFLKIWKVGFAEPTHSRSRFWYDTPIIFERWHGKQLQASTLVPNNPSQKSIGGSGDLNNWKRAVFKKSHFRLRPPDQLTLDQDFDMTPQIFLKGDMESNSRPAF